VADGPQPAATEPGGRGELDIRDRAVQSIVVAAALTSPDVHRHRSGPGRLPGRVLPRATVEVAGERVCADVEIAVGWGRPLGAVAAATGRHVRDALEGVSGLAVDRVTVHVGAVIPPGDATTQGRELL
jgi:uncharacterized alkaline shock family protein YloU